MQSALDDSGHINEGVPAIVQTAEPCDDKPDRGIWNTLQSILMHCVHYVYEMSAMWEALHDSKDFYPFSSRAHALLHGLLMVHYLLL